MYRVKAGKRNPWQWMMELIHRKQEAHTCDGRLDHGEGLLARYGISTRLEFHQYYR